MDILQLISTQLKRRIPRTGLLGRPRGTGVGFSVITWQQAGIRKAGNLAVLQTLPVLEFSVFYANYTVERNWTYMPSYPLDVLPNVYLANGAVLVSGLHTCSGQECLVISIKSISIHDEAFFWL
jgi:hypothetical protein